ncbi:DUF3040 domain-containing protein [Haloactinomyces albus]|uniref:DUF3040 domain-containing protein n=1 Tax=Haloactinomyces albus TaxID=1352928 RepID=A0AAE3ZAA3_9ACTN|nr:DUF3040 domain-containing protein [Haloactinomyces albus]MDR7300215.1 hypothetical protein [Haloactinomyces albus]
MLSKRERETLAAIELGLAEDAPQLAEQFHRFDQDDTRIGRFGRRRGRRLLLVMMLFFGGLALVCILGGLVLGGVAAGLLAASIGSGLLYLKRKTGGNRPHP